MFTSRDLTEEDRLRLNGNLERVVQKGSTILEHLLTQVHEVLARQPELPLWT